MRCSKSCYLYDLELVDLFENAVIEQVNYNISIYFYARLSFSCEDSSIADILLRSAPEQRKLRLDSNHLMSAVTSDLSR